MISRRSFLKLGGLTALAIGAGAGTGSLVGSASARRFAMHGFVPDNDRIAADLLRAFISELPEDARGLKPIVYADGRWTGVVRSAFGGSTHSSGPIFTRGRIVIRMSALEHKLPGDVLVLDDRKCMYTPERDFSGSLSNLRTALRGSDARYQISAEYVDSAPLASLFAGERVAVIENERGIVDRISPQREAHTAHQRTAGSHRSNRERVGRACAFIHMPARTLPPRHREQSRRRHCLRAQSRAAAHRSGLSFGHLSSVSKD
jgi:hypothetical protein